jgi:hypothetical protein
MDNLEVGQLMCLMSLVIIDIVSLAAAMITIHLLEMLRGHQRHGLLKTPPRRVVVATAILG